MTLYSAVKAFHIMAAFAAYGLPFAYPFVLPYLHRHHPEAVRGLHAIQHRLNKVLTGPGTALLFIFGTYMATKNHLWGEAWVDIPIAILAIIVIAGALIVRWTGELATTPITTPEYTTTYRLYMTTEIMLGLLVLVAILFMTAKPFA